MDLALDLLLSAIAVLVLIDLIFGLATGRLRLLSGDRSASPTAFWFYVFVEAVLVLLVGLSLTGS